MPSPLALLLSCSLVVLAGALCPAGAVAQDASVKRRLVEMGRLYKRGVQATAARRYGQALRIFQKAYLLAKSAAKQARNPRDTKKFLGYLPIFLYTMGKTQQYAKRYASAHEYYKRCLRAAPGSSSAKEARRELAVIAPYIEATLRLEIRPAKAVVALRLSRPYHAPRRARLPYQARLPAGRWTVLLLPKGGAPLKLQIALRPRQTTSRLWHLCGGRLSPKPCPALRPKPAGPALFVVVGWINVGVGIAGALMSATMLGIAHGGVPAFREQQGQGTLSNQEAFEAGRQLENFSKVGVISAILAGLALTTGVLFLALPRKKPPRPPSPAKRPPPPSPKATLWGAR